MRLLVQAAAAVHRREVGGIDAPRDVEEALRSQEEAGPRLARAQRRLELCGERIAVELAVKWAVVGRAALHVELQHPGERLDERRLAAAVLADEERDRRVEGDRVDLLDRRDFERIPAPPALLGHAQQVRAGAERTPVRLRHQRNTDTMPTMHGASTSAGR